MGKEEEIHAGKEILWKERRRLWCGLPWTFTVYRLSSDRLYIKTGFFSLREDEVRLYRIKDVSLNRSLIQRIFGLGTVHVCSTDSTLRDFDLKNIKDSESVKERLSDLVEAERDRKRVSMREFIGHGGPDDLHGDEPEDFDDIDMAEV